MPLAGPLKRGVFKNVDELVAAIELFVLAHNETPKPFIWTKSAQDILKSASRPIEYGVSSYSKSSA